MSDPTSPAAAAHGFGLVPLECPTCGAALAASGEDVVYYCTACRNGYRYQPEEPHLARLEVLFVAAANIAAERYLPFWVLAAQVEVRNRRAGRTMPDLFQALFGGGGGRGRTPTGDVQFVVPAFQADLDSTVELARRYTREFPSLGERLGERLVGGCYGVDDARKLAHFAVLAGEIDEPDVVKSIEVSIRFGDARLLGVPFVRAGDGWQDAIYAIRTLDVDRP